MKIFNKMNTGRGYFTLGNTLFLQRLGTSRSLTGNFSDFRLEFMFFSDSKNLDSDIYNFELFTSSGLHIASNKTLHSTLASAKAEALKVLDKRGPGLGHFRFEDRVLMNRYTGGTINDYEKDDIMMAPLYLTLTGGINQVVNPSSACELTAQLALARWLDDPIYDVYDFRDSFVIGTQDKRMQNILKNAVDGISIQTFDKEGADYCKRYVVWLAGRSIIHDAPSAIVNNEMGLIL